MSRKLPTQIVQSFSPLAAFKNDLIITNCTLFKL